MVVLLVPDEGIGAPEGVGAQRRGSLHRLMRRQALVQEPAVALGPPGSFPQQLHQRLEADQVVALKGVRDRAMRRKASVKSGASRTFAGSPGGPISTDWLANTARGQAPRPERTKASTSGMP